MVDLTKEALAMLGPKRPCSCGADPGERHNGDDCDVARCRITGQQLFQCGGEIHEYKGREYGEHEGECGPDTWTGHWPGEVEAAEHGWFVKWVPPPKGHLYGAFVPVAADDPEASADLNRVGMELRWNPETERYEDRD